MRRYSFAGSFWEAEESMSFVQRLQHASVPMPRDGHAAARRFYGDALGMPEIAPPSSLQGIDVVWFEAGDGGHEIHCFADADHGPNSPGQHLCLQVHDLAGVRAQLSRYGVTVEDPIAIPTRPRCFVRDPFGNGVELTEINGDYRDRP
jgi:catechol 2,3-dioxygenase-like lactoylglutathione lyase family enzyme